MLQSGVGRRADKCRSGYWCFHESHGGAVSTIVALRKGEEQGVASPPHIVAPVAATRACLRQQAQGCQSPARRYPGSTRGNCLRVHMHLNPMCQLNCAVGAKRKVKDEPRSRRSAIHKMCRSNPSGSVIVSAHCVDVWATNVTQVDAPTQRPVTAPQGCRRKTSRRVQRGCTVGGGKRHQSSTPRVRKISLSCAFMARPMRSPVGVWRTNHL